MTEFWCAGTPLAANPFDIIGWTAAKVLIDLYNNVCRKHGDSDVYELTIDYVLFAAYDPSAGPNYPFTCTHGRKFFKPLETTTETFGQLHYTTVGTTKTRLPAPEIDYTTLTC